MIFLHNRAAKTHRGQNVDRGRRRPDGTERRQEEGRDEYAGQTSAAAAVAAAARLIQRTCWRHRTVGRDNDDAGGYTRTHADTHC